MSATAPMAAAPRRIASLLREARSTRRSQRSSSRRQHPGMLTKAEAAARLNMHEQTLVRWAEHGLISRHAYNAHAYLYDGTAIRSGPNHPFGRRLSSIDLR